MIQRILVLLVATCSLLPGISQSAQSAEPVNVLLITVDDMNFDSIGVFGSKLKY